MSTQCANHAILVDTHRYSSILINTHRYSYLPAHHLLINTHRYSYLPAHHLPRFINLTNSAFLSQLQRLTPRALSHLTPRALHHTSCPAALRLLLEALPRPARLLPRAHQRDCTAVDFHLVTVIVEHPEHALREHLGLWLYVVVGVGFGVVGLG